MILGENKSHFQRLCLLIRLMTSRQAGKRQWKILAEIFQRSAVCHILNAIAFLDFSIQWIKASFRIPYITTAVHSFTPKSVNNFRNGLKRNPNKIFSFPRKKTCKKLGQKGFFYEELFFDKKDLRATLHGIAYNLTVCCCFSDEL